ncbi:MAG TPA: hypothetical protein DD670_11815, partial [Planctomycetaceae bacterium]|nr:hypothetical protein [Planctomycetaceae bacterium]
DLPHWTKTRDGNRDWWQPIVADAMSLNNIPKDDRIDGKPVNFYAVIYAGNDHGFLKSVNRNVFMGAGRRGLSNRVFRDGKVPYWEDRWHGKQITFSPERWRLEPSGMYGVGLLYHELGHMLGGFRDLYGEANGDFGRWAIMGLGEKTHFPTGPTALNRYIAGWLTYDVPAQQGRHRLRLPPIQTQRAVKLVNGPMPWADALVVEHRVRPNPLARTLPAEGLFVYEAYGKRRVRNVRWDAKANKSVVVEQRQRVVRADGTPKNQPGDAFRGGNLTAFGKSSAASSATGCGYWELHNIDVPPESKDESFAARMRKLAAFEAVYLPERIATRRGTAPIHLARRLSPGDQRLYVRVAGGGCTVEGDDTLLNVPAPAAGQSNWGLVDVCMTNDLKRLSVVPDTGAQIEEIQAVPRKPVLLNLLASPHVERLAAGLGGRVTTSAPLADAVWAGQVIEIPLNGSQSPGKATAVTCPGGVLRLALRGVTRDRRTLPDVTLVIEEGGKRQTYLRNVALHHDRPEFFVIDCRHLRGKQIGLELAFKGPKDGQVVLWEAGFVAE